MIAARLAGDRLHLQHGPIDLVIGIDGAREAGFAAAAQRFETILDELVAELPLLRTGMPVAPGGVVGRRMARAVSGVAEYVTPMAAVAGAVADEVLAAVRGVDGVERAYVNNGGDIAIWLTQARRFDVGIAGLTGVTLGQVSIGAHDGIGGVATSGWAGRSLSLGIAQSVTVLAGSAAGADGAATLIANAVDVPGCAAIARERACDVDPDSDLGTRLVVRAVGALTAGEIASALDAGAARAREMVLSGSIVGAALVLRGETRVVGCLETGNMLERMEEYA